eukprot:CAMPEP_0197620902 /NCGR_PEP_ID=MMETSP1338-20131121/1608_1 /TAXON_ID=43686 ORGANISM="Pelagodinium beii, Strain RCC1491" /NCGR_SAMPLE_ID=MMETSP1338 /ASSEMBLY_ACC=CAM_ASM_000754 /LENGTH=405 /DNA_ID=CAMNT_0043190207 /DNA_START=76 /DNA_END=1293 /DNA_ORIENTATION=-
MKLQDATKFQPKSVVYRDLDGCPFRVAVVRLHKAEADVVYLDDGNVEQRVPLEELSVDEAIPKESWNPDWQKMWDDCLAELNELQDSDSELEQANSEDPEADSLPLPAELKVAQACKYASEERGDSKSEETESGESSVSEGVEEPSFEDYAEDFEEEEEEDNHAASEDISKEERVVGFSGPHADKVESSSAQRAGVEDHAKGKVDGDVAAAKLDGAAPQSQEGMLESMQEMIHHFTHPAEACNKDPASDVEEDEDEDADCGALLASISASICADSERILSDDGVLTDPANPTIHLREDLVSACDTKQRDADTAEDGVAQATLLKACTRKVASVLCEDAADKSVGLAFSSDDESEFGYQCVDKSPELDTLDTDAKAGLNADKETWFSELPIRYQMFVHYGLHGSLD